MKTLHTIYTNFAKRLALVLTLLLTLGVISVWAETSTFTWGTNPSAYTSGSSNFSEGQVTFTGTKGTGSTPTRAWSDGLRMYAGGTAQFSVPDGYVITKIEGYTTFNFNDATGQQTVLFAGLSKATCSTDVTVTYQSSGYTITYNTNGGTAVSSTTGTKLPNPLPTTTKTGYTFAGWFTNSELTTAATAGATINADITLYAKWTANKYTVKFNGNGNTGGSMTDQSFTYDVAQDLTANAFEKFGHTFAGWSKTSNGSVVYTDGQSVSNLTSTNNGTVTLYAKWTEKALTNYRTSCSTKTLVTLHPNGGTISEDSWEPTDGEVTYTKTVETTSAVTLPIPTKDGYEFGGWYEHSEFTGSAVTAVPEGTKGEKIYYAKWNCIAPISVTVTPTNENGWRYSIGETISLEATATGGSADAYSYQWQKYIESDWEDIDGATSQVYTKENCGTGDGGTYRCVVSTGDVCSKESEGFWVRVFTLAGNFESNTEWNDEKIIWSTEDNQHTIGTVTLTLSANETYEFKVADNDGRWFGNPGIINATTDWWGFGVDDDNCTLQTKQAGEYIFTIDVEHAGDSEGTYVNVKVTFPTTQIIYFKPATSGTWADDAKFTIYSWGSGDPSYTPLEDKDCGGIYSAEINTTHTSLLFIKASTYKENFDNITAQTIDLTAPTGDKVLYDMELTNVLYLKPNDNWKKDGARFAAYFCKKGDDGFGNKWMSMSDSDNNGIYDCSIPTDKTYPNVVFCRMNGGNSTNNWDNRWNQTGDLTIPTDGKNRFDIPDGTWDGATTTWSTIYDDSKWITYTPKHTVSFNANGHGTAPEDQCITDGGKVTQPTPAPTATGYTFDGWYEEAGCTNAWDFANDVVTSDITLYAKWTAKTITITWDANGGSVTPTSSTYTYDGATITLPTPTYTGYTFSGWFTAASGGTQITEVGTNNKPTENVTYYAQWKFIPILQWSASSYTAALEADNDYPELTTTPPDLTGITYSSSDESVATIDDNTGEITLVGVGETTITASFAGNDTYAPATSASYTLTVVESNCRWVEVTDNTTLEDGDEVVITMGKSGKTYALPNVKRTSSYDAPEATDVTSEIVGNEMTSVANDLKWTIDIVDDYYVFYTITDEGRYNLYCNDSDDGVCVAGTDNALTNHKFSIEGNYLKSQTQSRYLAISFRTSSWRSILDNTTATYSGQTLKFYKRECLDPTEVWVEGNLTDVTCTPQLPQIIAKDGGSITLTFTAAEGYALPTSVSVEMGSTTLTPSWNRTTGELTINAPTGGFTDNVLVTVEALQVKTVTFSVDSEDTAPIEMQAEENTDIILPAFTTNLTCVKFIGWTDAANDAAITSGNIYKAGDSYTVTDDITLKAVYAASGGFVLVTDANDLAVGDRIVIAAAESNVAMGTDRGNNRGEVEVTKDNTDNTITTPDGIQILTLEAGTTAGTLAFNTGEGYLYAASSGSNYLKTQTTNDANGSWTISINSEGIATIKAQGSNTRNWLRYNSGSHIFSCYASGQADVSIYKESITGYTTDPECKMYNVTLCTPTNGTISVDKTIVDPYGSTILTFAPAAGYMLDAVTITSGTAEVGTVSYTSNQTSDGTVKISNIQSDIEVCATFKEIPFYKVTFVDMNNGNAETIVHQPEFGGDITAPATASAGCDITWTFIGWAPSNELNGTPDIPANFVEAGGTISGANITSNLVYYSVYSNSSDGTPPFSIGKSGTYYFKAITEDDEVYYATGELNSTDRYPTNSTPKIPFLLTYNSTLKQYTIKNTLSNKYLAPDSYDDSALNEQDDSFNWDIIQPTLYADKGYNAQAKTGEYLFCYTMSDGTSVRYLYCNKSYFDSWSRDNSKYALYLEPASEMHYYNASDCSTDDYVTMSFHNPFGSSKAQLQYEVGYEEDYYTNTSKKYVDVFPTLEYAGWTFIGWTAGSSYNDGIGEENLNDENSSASAPTQDIYKTGGGLSYYLGSDVTMYPVFTKFEDNEPFDIVNGGDYYMYYIADGDIGTSVDEYGAAQRIYATGWTGEGSASYSSTQNCDNATLFTFTKLDNGKWTIYDNTFGNFLYARSNDISHREEEDDGTKNIKEWAITIFDGNQFEAIAVEGNALSANSTNAISGTFKNYATSNFNNNSKYYHRVYLGTCTERVYSSNPTNKPAITLSGEPIVTSTQDQSIRAQGELSISATKLAANGTITLTADNEDVYFATDKTANFSKATKPVTPLTLKADEKGKLATTTVYVHYKPSTSTLGVQTANITATTGTEGEEDYATAETTAQVRNLPTNFVIAAKWGDNWYAMPADMNSQSSTEGWLIEVDDAANPTKALAAPNTTKYGLKSVYTSNSTDDRFENYGERLVFVENVTEATPVANKTLYNGGGSGTSNTNIQVYAQYTNYYNDDAQAPRYEWIPTTTNMQDYTLTSAHQFTKDDATLENARTVSLDNHGEFGTLLQDKSYNGMVRLLPVDNFYEPIELQVVEWKQNSVSVMYTGAGTKYTTKVGNNAESSAQTLSAIDHAVYSLSTTDLTTATNQPLIIYIKDDADVTVGAIKLTVPAIVSENKGSTELSVTAENAKATNIVILDGATLTAGTTKYTYNDVVVYPGGKLVIGQNGQLGMYSLTLRAGSSWGAEKYENKYPQFLLKGVYSNSSGQINLDYVTTTDYYYPLSVPEQVTIDDIKYPEDIYGNNVKANNNGSFQLKYYDGAQRVDQGSQYGTGWVVVNENTTTTLEPNQGYAIWGIPKKVSVNGATSVRQKYGIHRIPIKKAAGDLATNEITNAEVQITAHGDASTPPNDRGWNYLGNPYLAQLGGMNGEDPDLQIGKLEQEKDANGDWTGGWVYNGDNIRYITVTNDCQTFEAKPVAEAQIPAFTTFFIQAASVDNPMILLTAPASVLNVSSLPARHYDAQQETAKEITTGIILTGNDQTDRTGLLIADNFTEEYDFNADLSKFENSGINLYTIGKDGKLAFMAINQALAEQPIPVGYSAPAEGLYTIAFDEDRYNATDISALYLIDYDSNEKTNLLHTDYSFVTAAGTNNQRFALQVAFVPANSTNVEWVGDATIQVGVEGHELILNNLPTDATVHVFDALGRLMYHTPTAPTEIQLTLPTGYYLVRIADKQHAVVTNIVIP